MSEPFDPYRKWLGIPPKDQPPNHYRLLGVELFEEDADAISNAADRQMAHVRTFQTGQHSAVSQKLLNEVSAARVCLLNAEKKAEYDGRLKKKLAAAAPQADAASKTATPKAAPKPVRAADSKPIPVAIPTPAATTAAPAVSVEPAAPKVFETAGAKYAARQRRSAWQAPVAIGVALIAVGGGVVAYMKSQPATIAQNSPSKGQKPGDNTSRPVDSAGPKPGDQSTVPRPGGIDKSSPPPTGTSSTGKSSTGKRPVNPSSERAEGATGRTDDRTGKPLPSGKPATNGETNPTSSGELPTDPMPDDEPSDRTPEMTDDPEGEPDEGDSESVPDSQRPGGKVTDGSSKPQAVNLIESIDLDRDIVAGNWTVNGQTLSTKASEAARLQLPSSLPPQYQLTVVAERKSGRLGVAIGLVVGKSYVTLVLDGWSGQTSGLSMVNGQNSDDNPTTHRGQVLLDGQPNTIVCQVRRNSIDVTCNDELVVRWQGDTRQLSPWTPRWDVPDDSRLFIGAWNTAIEFTRIELAPLDGSTPRPAMVAAAPSNTNTERPDGNGGRTLGGLLDSAANKAPAPTPEKMSEAEKSIEEVFGEELEAAKTLEARFALGKKLYERATQTRDDDTARYALLMRARDLAATSGDVKAVLMPADELIKWYDVDGPLLKAECLEKVSKAPAVGRSKADLASSADDIAGQLIAKDQLEPATRVVAIGTAAARAAKDPNLLKRLVERQRELDKTKKAYAALEEPRERLKLAPDDPDANLALGRYYCFVKRDWERGLPLLAKASDETLKALANQDLADPSGSEEQLKLADDWWELGQQEKTGDKKALLVRAAYWYAEAAPNLTGLNQEKAQKRVQEASQDEATPAAKTIYLADAPEQNVVVERDYFRKGQTINDRPIRVKGIESPKGLFMHPQSNKFASVAYVVGRRGRLFIADIGIDDNAGGPMRGPVVFEVWADNVKLWNSGPVTGKGYTEHCEVSLGRAEVLVLRVVCPGRNNWAHAVWSEPRVVLK